MTFKTIEDLITRYEKNKDKGTLSTDGKRLLKDLKTVLNLYIVSSTFKEKYKKDIKELEIKLEKIENDYENNKNDLSNWFKEISIISDRIKVLRLALNCC